MKSGSTARQVLYIKNILILGVIAGFVLSPRLWLAERGYPLLPVADFLPSFPALGYVPLSILIGLLTIALLVKKPSIFLWVFIASAGLLTLWDQSRLQPWFYQYVFMLAALSIALSIRTDNAQQGALQTCRFILASIYLWSGIQKWNPEFLYQIYPWFMGPLLERLSGPLSNLLLSLGILVPCIEIALGLGLLLPALRRDAAIGIVGMHLFILFMLSPLNLSFNTVVWPWNITMIALVVVLFGKQNHSTLKEILWPARFWFSRVVLVLFGLMPLFSLVGLWDSYLSSSLYASNQKDGYLHVSSEGYDALPSDLKEVAFRKKQSALGEPEESIWPYRIRISDWSYADLNVPPYPAKRTMKSVARFVSQITPDSDDIKLTIPSAFDLELGMKPHRLVEF